MFSGSKKESSLSGLPPLQTSAEPGKILYVREARSTDDWNSVLHEHPFGEFFYVTYGRGKMILLNQEMIMQEGDLIFVNPRIRHTEARIEEEPFGYIVIGIEGLQLRKVNEAGAEEEVLTYMEEQVQRGLWSQNYRHHPEVGLLFRSMVQESRQAGTLYKQALRHLLALLLINMWRLSDAKLEILAGGDGLSPLAYARRFLDEHFARDIHLADLARISFINKYQLVREFKHSYGTTPMQYLQERRLSAAADLLRRTDHPVETIASMVGFRSAAYFSRCFREYSGETPLHYRRSGQALTLH